eukprot:1470085-Prymnesium_polylepis.1
MGPRAAARGSGTNGARLQLVECANRFGFTNYHPQFGERACPQVRGSLLPTARRSLRRRARLQLVQRVHAADGRDVVGEEREVGEVGQVVEAGDFRDVVEGEVERLAGPQTHTRGHGVRAREHRVLPKSCRACRARDWRERVRSAARGDCAWLERPRLSLSFSQAPGDARAREVARCEVVGGGGGGEGREAGGGGAPR